MATAVVGNKDALKATLNEGNVGALPTGVKMSVASGARTPGGASDSTRESSSGASTALTAASTASNAVNANTCGHALVPAQSTQERLALENALLAKAEKVESFCRENVQFRFEKSLEKVYKVGKPVIADDDDDGKPIQGKRRGVVFGKNRETGEIVVIKFRHKTKAFTDDKELQEWVLTMKILYRVTNQDAEMAKTLPHISRIVDILEDQTYYYVMMEYVRGRDLFDFFRGERLHEKSNRLQVCKGLCFDLCLCLQELHGLGLIHKDLKLENVVLCEEHHEKVYSRKSEELCRTCAADPAKWHKESQDVVSYAAEKWPGEEEDGSTPSSPSAASGNKLKPRKRPRMLLKLIDYDTVEVYRPGVKGFHVMGTDQYIAPESYAGLPCPASDVWAVGVILYTMLTGTFPFHYALFDDEKGENYVGHEKMDRIRRRLRLARIDWSNKAWSQNAHAKNFVRHCFVCNVEKRLPVRYAISHHPWMTTDESGLETGGAKSDADSTANANNEGKSDNPAGRGRGGGEKGD
jgi:serine/threonine protein kinase